MAFGAWYTRSWSKTQDHGEGSCERVGSGVNIISLFHHTHETAPPSTDVHDGYWIRHQPLVTGAYLPGCTEAHEDWLSVIGECHTRRSSYTSQQKRQLHGKGITSGQQQSAKKAMRWAPVRYTDYSTVGNVDAMFWSASSADHGTTEAPLWATLTSIESVQEDPRWSFTGRSAGAVHLHARRGLAVPCTLRVPEKLVFLCYAHLLTPICGCCSARWPTVSLAPSSTTLGLVVQGNTPSDPWPHGLAVSRQSKHSNMCT